MVGLSTFAFQQGWIGPTAWMILIGLGLYAAYVPYGCILFDRLICHRRSCGNSGLPDLCHGCLWLSRAVALMIYRDLGKARSFVARVLSIGQLRDFYFLYGPVRRFIAPFLALYSVHASSGASR